jgi:hypothetical protein
MNIKHRTLIIFILFSKFTFSQNINLLDEKNGFKTLKLGESLDKYKKDLTLLGINELAQGVFLYVGNDANLKNLFNVPVDSILLRFNKEKMLISIRLTIKPIMHSPLEMTDIEIKEIYVQHNDIMEGFKQLFGLARSHPRRERVYYWQSSKVYLDVSPDSNDRYTRNIVDIISYSGKKLIDGF